jgi:hypothetical protein
MLDEVPPFDPYRDEDAPVPRAALAWPLLALAAPTPRLDPVPALPDEEPAVPIAVLALPLPEVDAPEPTVEELCANAIGAAVITAAIAAAENSVLECNMLFFSSDHCPVTQSVTSRSPARSAMAGGSEDSSGLILRFLGPERNQEDLKSTRRAHGWIDRGFINRVVILPWRGSAGAALLPGPCLCGAFLFQHCEA